MAERSESSDAAPAVADLARLLSGPELQAARQAAASLTRLAQYRLGDIGPAVPELARAVASPDQELRKHAAEALKEAAENGPGIWAAVGSLREALEHPTKHVRQLASQALAAHFVDAGDAASLDRLLSDPRSQVAQKAIGYLRRGAQWKDLSFAVPLLCQWIADPDRRTQAARILVAYVRGPRGVRIDPHTLAGRAREILAALDAASDPPRSEEWRELREDCASVLRGAIGPDALLAAIRELVGGNAARRAEAANTLQLASLYGVDIGPAVWPLLEFLAASPEEDVSSVVFALVKHFTDRADWREVEKLLAHEGTEIRLSALKRIHLEAIRSATDFTPLAGAIGKLLTDPDPEVRSEAAGTLFALAVFGSAARPTRLQEALPDMQAAIQGGAFDPASVGELEIAAVFGGVGLFVSGAPAQGEPAGDQGPRCMHGSPYDPEIGRYLCGKC